jgi:hypothetical protein
MPTFTGASVMMPALASEASRSRRKRRGRVPFGTLEKDPYGNFPSSKSRNA